MRNEGINQINAKNDDDDVMDCGRGCVQDGAFKTSKKRTPNFFKCILTKHTSLTSYSASLLHFTTFLCLRLSTSTLLSSYISSFCIDCKFPPLSNTSIWWMGLLLKSNSAKNDRRLRSPCSNVHYKTNR